MSLSNNTVRSRIVEMTDDIFSHVISTIQNYTFNLYAFQLDETTDIAYLAPLCVYYVRYINDNHLEDEFLFCKTLSTITTAADIFNKVDKFFIERVSNGRMQLVYVQMERNK